jgi:hypothetical protein
MHRDNSPFRRLPLSLPPPYRPDSQLFPVPFASREVVLSLSRREKVTQGFPTETSAAVRMEIES